VVCGGGTCASMVFCCGMQADGGLKEIPHNMDGSLAGEFHPLAACKISITRQVNRKICKR